METQTETTFQNRRNLAISVILATEKSQEKEQESVQIDEEIDIN